jgi:hypothetical protein
MSGTIVAHSKPAVFGRLVRVTVKAQQCRYLRIRDENDVSTVAPVAPIGTSERLELFTPHRDTPVATVAGSKVERDVVNECGHVNSISFAVAQSGG